MNLIGAAGPRLHAWLRACVQMGVLAAWLDAGRAQAYLADAYSYWTQHVNMEGDFDLRYLVRCRINAPYPRPCAQAAHALLPYSG